MNEDFLSFVWKYRLYRKDLITITGEPVTVISPGEQHRNSGPDFFNARIKIGDTLWAGNVEIHVRASDWYRHNHQTDQAYNNVILHVVFDADSEIIIGNHTTIPTISLSEQTDDAILKKYASLKASRLQIPCGNNLKTVKSITLNSWVDRMLVERLEFKSVVLEQALEVNKGDWEDAFYQMLARNFGFNVNAGPFEMVARCLPRNLLMKHADQIHQLEALLFGQAGFLEGDFSDSYPQLLQNEYGFLSKKYGLMPLDRHIWKLLRMRPANFPTIRISQFAALMASGKISFHQIKEITEIQEILDIFNIAASPYWDTHFVFDKGTRFGHRQMGVSSIHNIIINTIAPFLFYFGRQRDEPVYSDRAFKLLEALPAEKNHLLQEFINYEVPIDNAYTSQAFLSLYRNFCSQKKCLNCGLGIEMLYKQNE